MDREERIFWRGATLTFALFAGVMYAPVLVGKIPFPRDMVLQFPAWAGRVRSEAWNTYADIGDLVTFFYPARDFAARWIKAGVMPLWNPLLISGEPFLATAQSSMFYPPNVLYYLLPVPLAWTAGIILRMFLAALFCAIFVRSIGGSKTGSIFSGVVFASSGFLTAWQGQPMGDGAIWLPFVCYTVQRLHADPSRVSMAFAAIGFAMPVLAGHPEVAAHVTLTGTALALTLCSQRLPRSFIAHFMLAGMLAIGLASVQMIPTLEWLREIGDALKPVWPALGPHQILGWFTRDVLRGPNSAGVNIPEAAAYVVMLSILAAPLAAFHRSRVFAGFLAVVTLFALAVAYGVEPVYGLVSRLPVIGALKNSRLILVANFAIAALGGMGISVIEDGTLKPTRRVAALALVGAAFAFAFILVYRLRLATSFRVEFMHRPSFTRTLLIASLLLVIWKLYGGLRGRLFPIAVCGLAIFDAVTFGFGYTGFTDRRDIFPDSPVFDFLARQDTSQFRVIEAGALAYSANAQVMYGVPSADGYEVRIPKLQQAFTRDLTYRDSDGIYFIPDRLLETRDRRIDLLNVKYFVLTAHAPEAKLFAQSDRFVPVFNSGYTAVFENKSALPRAWMVPQSGAEILTGVDAQLNRLKDPAFDPRKRVVLAEPLASSVTPIGDGTGQARMTENGITQLGIQTEATMAAVLVVSQTYYPGWKAFIDGKEVKVLRANLTLTGIPVPAGLHKVQLVFQPMSFRIGLGLTMLSALVLATIFIASSRGRTN